MNSQKKPPTKWILIALAAIAVGGFAYQQRVKHLELHQPVESIPAAQQSALPAAAPSASAGIDLTPNAEGLSKATVVIKTDKGVIKYKFFPKEAPLTTARLVELIQSGFYNGLKFHRIVPGFVAQGGDPQGDGTGGSGKKIKLETSERKHVEGAVAMARRSDDQDSNDSQFYISYGRLEHLDGGYTVFGQVIEGMDIARKLEIGDAMTSVTIE